jgi:hypothetical protein
LGVAADEIFSWLFELDKAVLVPAAVDGEYKVYSLDSLQPQGFLHIDGDSDECDPVWCPVLVKQGDVMR